MHEIWCRDENERLHFDLFINALNGNPSILE